jgi:hypothetical protein
MIVTSGSWTRSVVNQKVDSSATCSLRLPDMPK